MPPRGRPKLDPADDTVVVSVRMTQTQKAKLELLGGPSWIRNRITRARLPNCTPEEARHIEDMTAELNHNREVLGQLNAEIRKLR